MKVQGTNFTADFYLLPLGGCDMVLSIHWLRLGPIVWDFEKLTMEFSLANKHVVFNGLNPIESLLESSSTFSKMPHDQRKGLIVVDQ